MIGLTLYLYKKAFAERFGFDAVESSKFKTVCQKQSSVNALWDVYMHSFAFCFVGFV